MKIRANEWPKYPKIESLYKRDDKGNFTGELTSEYFSYLYSNTWIGTEKVDGTNLRIVYDNMKGEIELFGRGSNSEIPNFLYSSVISKYRDLESYERHFSSADKVVFYGEGYGSGIQKPGKRYRENDTDFILFDIWVDGWWLKRDSVIGIANQMGMRVVPEVFEGTLREAEALVSRGIYSYISEDTSLKAEGIVLTPKEPLFDRRGHRIITKLKTKDFTSDTTN